MIFSGISRSTLSLYFKFTIIFWVTLFQKSFPDNLHLEHLLPEIRRVSRDEHMYSGLPWHSCPGSNRCLVSSSVEWSLKLCCECDSFMAQIIRREEQIPVACSHWIISSFSVFLGVVIDEDDGFVCVKWKMVHGYFWSLISGSNWPLRIIAMDDSSKEDFR